MAHISVEIPEGKTYKQTTDENGNILIKIVDNKTCSRYWEEFCKNNPIGDNVEYFIDNSSKIVEYKSQTEYDKERNSILDRNSLATEEDAEGILALIQLTRLHDEWVGNWKPDWLSKEVKYVIRRIFNSAFEICDTICSPRLLSFPSQGMAREFLACFEDLIKKAKRFI